MNTFVKATLIGNSSTASFGCVLNHDSASVKKKKFQCEFCESKYSQKFVLSQHIRRIHKKELPYRCDICPFAAVIRSELTQHKRKHGIFDRDYPCRYCNETFKVPRLRRVHETFHTGKVFNCTICHKVFREKTYFMVHQKSHKKVLCKFCDKSFRTVEILEKHELSHTENGGELGMGLDKKIRFSKELNVIKTCILCNCDVNSLRELKNHVIKEHYSLFDNGKDNKNIQSWRNTGECPLCDKKVKTKSERITHLLGHIGVVLYKCHLCDYKCNWVKNLRVHFQKHLNKQQVWKCEFCQKICARKCQYTYHMMKRHGQRENTSDLYLCEICGKAFVHKCQLEKHKKKAHSELQNRSLKTSHVSRYKAKMFKSSLQGMVYECIACKLNFEHEINFDLHMKLHKEGRYACKKCGTKFDDKLTLKKHLKCHPGEFLCRVCNCVFDSYLDMEKHERLCSLQRVCFYCDDSTIIDHGDFLSAHLKEFHPSECLKCDTCRKIFSSFHLFNEHIVSHNLHLYDPTYHIYNPTCDSEDEEILGIWEEKGRISTISPLSLPRYSLPLCECSFCGDVFHSCKHLIEHEKKHTIPPVNLLKRFKPAVSSLMRERTKPACKNVNNIQICVLEDTAFAVDFTLLPNKCRRMYSKDPFLLGNSLNANGPSNYFSKQANVGRLNSMPKSSIENAATCLKESTGNLICNSSKSQNMCQTIRTSLMSKSGRQLQFVHRKIGQGLHSLTANNSATSRKTLRSPFRYLSPNSHFTELQTPKINKLTSCPKVPKIYKLLISPIEHRKSLKHISSRQKELPNLAYHLMERSQEPSSIVHISKDTLESRHHTAKEISDSTKVNILLLKNSMVHATKEYVIDIKIGERKVKEKVVFINGKKKYVTEDLGFFQKEVVLS